MARSFCAAGAPVAVVVLLTACEAPVPPGARFEGEAARAIINGQRSGAADFPTTGALLMRISIGSMSFGSLACTGSLIAPDVVLLAAHCTAEIFPGVTPEHWFTFDLDVSSFGQSASMPPPGAIPVKQMVAHPDFVLNGAGGMMVGLGNYKDVALAFLERPVQGLEPAVIVETDDAPSIAQGVDVDIAGYGQTSPRSMQAGVKFHARTRINEVGTWEMQIGDRAPLPQKCHGDSGGPTYLEVRDGLQPALRVAGITSRAYDMSDCERGGVDMRVDAFREWIEDAMIEACTTGVRTSCENGGAPRRPSNGVPPPDAGVPPDLGFPMEPDAGAEIDAGAPGGNTDGGPGADSGAGAPRDGGGSGGGGGGGGRGATPRGGTSGGGCNCSGSTSDSPSGSSSGSGIFVFAALVFLAAARRRR